MVTLDRSFVSRNNEMLRKVVRWLSWQSSIDIILSRCFFLAFFLVGFSRLNLMEDVKWYEKIGKKRFLYQPFLTRGHIPF